MKTTTALYPPSLLQIAHANIASYSWATEICERAVQEALPWAQMSDDELWALPFAPSMERSWMVWSDGFCPACRASVPMYSWEINALQLPWKVRCPHCQCLFPTNDFCAYYKSGIGPDGLFAKSRANQDLLFNGHHLNLSDPWRSFGVDDGCGYSDAEGHCWRFVGTYLVYGQWKQLIVGGLRKLSEAWLLTEDRLYAHKAAVLLDRVADLYPLYDFRAQGILYEGRHEGSGYVSNWHDACEETQDLALAYDAISDGIAGDTDLLSFLASKQPLGKNRIEDVHRNIQDNILRDALAHPEKIRSNWPARQIAECLILTALSWPENREEVIDRIDDVVRMGTEVDGLTGEKGLSAYSTLAPQRVAALLGRYSRIEPDFLRQIFARHPRLHDMCRFYIDTHCLHSYYPHSGDGGVFAQKDEKYLGVSLPKQGGTEPSGWQFLYEMYRLTGDVALAQTLYRENGHSTRGLPYDLFCIDAPAIQQDIEKSVRRWGGECRPASVNKEEWALAILRSGEAENARALWLDYDSGGSHGHADALTLGLFARGLDLMPDFGYPPVQYGGWESEKALWYRQSAAHNTVVVDQTDHRPARGVTTLWATGSLISVVSASVPEALDVTEPNAVFERTALLIDISPQDFYVFDLFHVRGGTRHCRMIRSHFGHVCSEGLSLAPSAPPWTHTQSREVRADTNPSPIWSVEWDVEDRYGYLPRETRVRLRYTDCSAVGGVTVYTAQDWVSAGNFGSSDQAWIPSVVTCRESRADMTTFAAVIEPYGTQRQVAGISLVLLPPEAAKRGAICVRVALQSGEEDIIAFAGPTGESFLDVPELGLILEGRGCWIRRHHNAVRSVAVFHALRVSVPNFDLRLLDSEEFIEICDGVVVSGNPESVSDLQIG
ncbi:MAG: heparinase II/III family protein [Armatimonadetes bacterium]|nr:heparinase II/III family protein [Armatimonadota bacterium]